MGFKGYSINGYVKPEKMINDSCMIFPEKIGATIMKSGVENMVRITAYGDLEGNNLTANNKRVQQIINAAKEMFGEDSYEESKASHWVGLRPVTPDDIPIIGQSSKFRNLYWNTGHGARGVMESTSSCKLLSNLINDESIHEEINPDYYDPLRFNM